MLPSKPKSFRTIALGIAGVMIVTIVLMLSWPAPRSQPGTVLITGANRGIGLALAQEYAERDWHVIATARRPDTAEALKKLITNSNNVRVLKLDVTSDEDIAALVMALQDESIDVLLNNAGSNAGGRGQKFGELDYGIFNRLMQINAVGPLKLAEALLPNILAGEHKKIIAISSIQASVAETYGGGYAYRASKTALNMVMRTLSRDLHDQRVIVGLLTPGTVATDMTKGLDIPMISPAESARGLADVIDTLTLERSGQFIRYDGTGVPW